MSNKIWKIKNPNNIPDKNRYLILLLVIKQYIKNRDKVINKTKWESTVPILVWANLNVSQIISKAV